MDYNMQLTNGKIALLPYHKKYIKDLHFAAIESMAELMPWMAWMHLGYSVEESKKWVKDCPKKWDKGTSFNFAITDASDGSYIGGCGIGGFDPTRKIANLGYWVRTAMTKRGIATAATSLLAKWGIEELNLQRIEIAAALPNLASQRVAEKVGAHREGILRNRMVVRDLLYDEVMFSIVPQDIKKPDSV